MRKRRNIMIKSIAWLLSLALLMTVIPFPAAKMVLAETVTDATNLQNPVYVAFELEDSTQQYNQYKVYVYNNSGNTVCDWEITMQFGAVPAINSMWNGVSYDENTKTMTIQTYGGDGWDNATIYNGDSASGAGFQINAGALDTATVTLTYSRGESSSGPATGAGGSTVTDSTTNLELDVEFNYAKLLQQSLYFYDAIMCGKLEDDCALSWRGNCHTYDSNVTYTSGDVTYSVDVSGGFHDAGDHVKFGLPQGYAASVLGMSYYQFKDAFDSLEQDAHLKTITDYFCDYFKRCTVYKQGSNDEVIAFCYQVGDGGTDHALWSAPETQTLDRPAYFADASNPATDQVSVAIAALALNYLNFGNEEDLKVAKDLFAFVQKNSLACATEGCQTYYNSTSYGDDYATAAAALYVATGKTNATYANVYNAYKDASDNGVNEYWVLDWANTGALAAMLMGDTAKLSNITKAGQDGTKIDNVFWCRLDWGSCRYNSATQFVGLTYDKLASANTYTDWATSQMNYMIGDNPSKRCYAVGYNENSSKYPHHRAASRSTEAGVVMENHYTLLGAMVGGPGSNGTYKDDQNNYECNEVALDYNAGYVGALAGLYLAHKDDTSTYLSYAGKTTTNYGTTLSTADELAVAGVTTYYGPGAGENPGEDPGDDPVEDLKPAELVSSVQQLECPQLEYGYVTASAVQTTLSNVGEVATTPGSIALETGNYFELVKPTTCTSISPAGTCVVEVRAKAGLLAGTYEDKVVISYEEKTLSIPVRVTVEKKAVTAVAFPSSSNLVQGQTLSDAALTGGDTVYGTFAWENPTQVVSKGTAEYNVVLTLNDFAKANYSFAGVDGYKEAGTIVRGVSVNVTRADLPTISFPAATDITYGQTLADSGLVGGSTEYGSFEWEDASDKPGANEIGSIQKNVIFTWNADCVEAYALATDELTMKQAVTLTVKKAQQTASPATPALKDRSADSVSVKAEEGVEYSLDGETDWQTAGDFENLSEFTEYKIYVRYGETATHKAGPAGGQPLLVYTLVADPYTIDVSKFGADNAKDYVDALRTANDSNPTVTYEDGVLTLTQENATYTLTGTNEELTVKALSASTKVELAEGAMVGSVEQDSEESGTTEEPGISDKPSNPEEPGTSDKPNSPNVSDTLKAPEKIIITGITKKVAPGKKIKFVAGVYPEDAQQPKILWKVSNKKYATVSSSGVVKAKKAGKGKSVILTAYSEDGKLQATVKVKIMKKAVKKLKLTAKAKTLKVGKTMKVKVKFTPAKGISKEVAWTSSNPSVATVDAKGKVKALKKGTVKITAKAKDGTGKKATIKIKVK